jgi:hypothetical protein
VEFNEQSMSQKQKQAWSFMDSGDIMCKVTARKPSVRGRFVLYACVEQMAFDSTVRSRNIALPSRSP